MISLWPQILVAALLLLLVIAGFVKHGDLVDPKPINCVDVIWRALVVAAILGAGGFWRLP